MSSQNTTDNKGILNVIVGGTILWKLWHKHTLKHYAAILSHAEYQPLTQKDVHNILSKKKSIKKQ